MDEQNLSIRNFSLINSLLVILNNHDENDTYFILAKYLLKHFDDLDELSIYDMADDCFVSRSSIHRFIKYIGFDNFTAMKHTFKETKIHYNAYISYATHTNFKKYVYESMNDMMKSINEMAELQDLLKLAKMIHDSNCVVIVISNTSSSSALEFQQGMIAIGKLVRIVTNSTPNLEILDSLTKNDLLITISVTGNYAIAIGDDVRKVNAYKCLITLNHSMQFEDYYNYIFYLSKKPHSSNHINHGLNNVYTRYGAGYFFDLLYNFYVEKYQTK